MKKIYIIATLLLFVTTGCTVDYEIELNDDTIGEVVQFNENIGLVQNNILPTGILTYQAAIDDLYTIPQPVYIDANSNVYDEMQIIDGVSYYDKELINDGMNYGIKGSFLHPLSDYKKSKAINKCYANISVLENDNRVVLSTSRQFLCFTQYTNLDAVNVKIKIDSKTYTVKSHNADNVDNNIYTWNITKNNSNNKSVVIEVEKNRTNEKQEKNNNVNGLIVFIAFGSIVGLVAFIVARNRNKKTNTI